LVAQRLQYFEDVPLLAWEFYIGGYQPAQKWLKDRRGRVLSFEDIRHYRHWGQRRRLQCHAASIDHPGWGNGATLVPPLHAQPGRSARGDVNGQSQRGGQTGHLPSPLHREEKSNRR